MKTKIIADIQEELAIVADILFGYSDQIYLSEHEIISNHLSFLLLDAGYEYHCIHIFKQAKLPTYQDMADVIHDYLVTLASKLRNRVEECHEIETIAIEPNGHCVVETKLSGNLLREERE